MSISRVRGVVAWPTAGVLACIALCLVVLPRTRLTQSLNWSKNSGLCARVWLGEGDQLRKDVKAVCAQGVGTVVVVAAGGDAKNRLGDEWLLCDGAKYRADEYPQLSAFLASAASADGKNQTFAVPDYRGLVVEMPSTESTTRVSNQFTIKAAVALPHELFPDRLTEVHYYVRAR